MLDPFLTQSYHFDLDPKQIASLPASPKDSAKLLVYNREKDTVTHTVFSNILKYIPQDCAILFNDTKVIKARIFGVKPSGGKIELLINRPLPQNLFSVYMRGRVKVDTTIQFDENLMAVVKKLHEDGTRDVAFFQHKQQLTFEQLEIVLNTIGHLPLPPYIHREDTKEDEINYQTVFAKSSGAVAAPTASLHFTPTLFEKVCTKHKHAFVTLHVGAGTFKPVESDDIRNHPMHSEYFSISQQALDILNSDSKLLTVGTTVTRTVEYFARTQQVAGEANLFLHPNNTPLRVDHLLTNFHLPKSTLLMLVASFVGMQKTLELYEIAKQQNYRFYSYGDAMLII